MIFDALVRPDRFFENRAPRPSLASAFGVVLVVALVTTAVFGFVGWSMSQRMTGTTKIDNPNRPDEVFCDGFAAGGAANLSTGCDRPEQKTVVIGNLVWEGFQKKIPFVFITVLLAWPLIAVGLHVASAVAGGEGSFSNTLAVAGWGMLPSLVQMLVGIGLFFLALRGADLSGSDPQVVLDQLQSLVATARGGTLFVSALGTAWQWVVWTYGLKHARRLSTAAAAAAAGAIAFLSFLPTLA
ncbi:Yip1 family protein (plasmid) [Haladaptatus sp. SPP-AMP-3]|uniref:Yip1 family protein n=1 Tax=Haladaptatus sp. SPP-AMP-3 TaxID=3121295 RepID=UPI003C2F084F